MNACKKVSSTWLRMFNANVIPVTFYSTEAHSAVLLWSQTQSCKLLVSWSCTHSIVTHFNAYPTDCMTAKIPNGIMNFKDSVSSVDQPIRRICRFVLYPKLFAFYSSSKCFPSVQLICFTTLITIYSEYQFAKFKLVFYQFGGKNIFPML